MSDREDLATAKKVSGTGFYLPAVKTAYGPKVLPHGERQDSRYAAVKEARRILREAATGGTD